MAGTGEIMKECLCVCKIKSAYVFVDEFLHPSMFTCM